MHRAFRNNTTSSLALFLWLTTPGWVYASTGSSAGLGGLFDMIVSFVSFLPGLLFVVVQWWKTNRATKVLGLLGLIANVALLFVVFVRYVLPDKDYTNKMFFAVPALVLVACTWRIYRKANPKNEG
ncbi:MAG: hypothetical protein EP343_08440 [Deltaproteobacteria bacterium]|nr:MAG: hypothetical protein EP343_08440 [Deltaproteobacteria bacterium]